MRWVWWGRGLGLGQERGAAPGITAAARPGRGCGPARHRRCRRHWGGHGARQRPSGAVRRARCWSRGGGGQGQQARCPESGTCATSRRAGAGMQARQSVRNPGAVRESGTGPSRRALWEQLKCTRWPSLSGSVARQELGPHSAARSRQASRSSEGHELRTAARGGTARASKQTGTRGALLGQHRDGECRASAAGDPGSWGGARDEAPWLAPPRKGSKRASSPAATAGAPAQHRRRGARSVRPQARLDSRCGGLGAWCWQLQEGRCVPGPARLQAQ
jgi:hypothetical protein